MQLFLQFEIAVVQISAPTERKCVSDSVIQSRSSFESCTNCCKFDRACQCVFVQADELRAARNEIVMKFQLNFDCDSQILLLDDSVFSLGMN